MPRKDAGVPAAGRQFDHVTIGVDSKETFVHLQDRARKAGIQASDIVDYGFARAIYFENPNGISLGLPCSHETLRMIRHFSTRIRYLLCSQRFDGYVIRMTNCELD